MRKILRRYRRRNRRAMRTYRGLFKALGILLLTGCATYLPEATRQYEVTGTIWCTKYVYSCDATIDIASGLPTLDCGDHPQSGHQLARIKRTETKYFYKKHPETIYTDVDDEVIVRLTECK